ncbi:tetratricopeptide repeat protein [Ruegeria sp. HKCCD7255]|uniref:tetratricopeptide repeat protein n=1 Tax=Ruegeria sp. HKCCD7255 TaxID=2683004 RepID=UPI001487BD13|nr:tetratricopeptide repeat protein [Ruegeria sp. HKCCD7255]
MTFPELIELFSGPLALAFIAATGVFTIVMAVTTPFSNTPLMIALSQRLSEFLTPQTSYKAMPSWHHAFMQRFDSSIGTRFFSPTGILKSFFISVCSVVFFAVLLSSGLETRAFWQDSDARVVWVVGLGVMVNAVPDYLSLRLTRFIVGRMARSSTGIRQAAWICTDVISTGLIIWLSIHVWRFYFDEPVLSLTEVMGLYSHYAIFFFSTFTASLVAFAFFLTQRFKIALTEQRYGRALCALLAADKNPVLTLCVAQYFVLVPVLFVIFLAMSKDEEGITHFDNFLCHAAGERICFYITRLSTEDASKLNYVRRGCEDGLTLECFQTAQAVLKMTVEEGNRLLQNACAIEETDACGLILDLEASGGALRISDATLEVTCEEDRPGACFVQGVRKLSEPHEATSYASGLEDLEKACQGSIAIACFSLGALYASGQASGVDAARVTALLKLGCDLGEMRSCAALGVRMLEGIGGARNPQMGTGLVIYACGRSLGDTCFESTAWAVHAKSRSEVAERHSAVLARGGCLGHGERSCNTLARLAIQSPSALGEDIEIILKDALAHNNDHGGLTLALANILLASRDVAEAQDVSRRFVKAKPCAHSARMGLGQLLDQKAGAQAALTAVSGPICAEFSLPWTLYASSLMEKAGDFLAAIRALESAHVHEPGNQIVINNLASLIAEHKSANPAALARAEELIEKIVELDAPPFLDTRGWVLTLSGRVSEGLPLLKRAADGMPNDALVRFHLGMAYELANQPVEAQKELEASLAIDQNHLRATEAREMIAHLAGKP